MPSRSQDPDATPLRALMQRGRRRGRVGTGAGAPPPADDWAPEPTGSGAVDGDAWQDALRRAADDPRAVPLSAVRLRVDAPGLTGTGRAEELRRLQAIATVAWREILRPADTLAQVGPSEFAVLLPRCDGAAAETIAGRLQAAVPEAARCRAGVATSARGDAPKLASDAARALAAAAHERDPLSDPGRLAAVDALRAALPASSGPELDRLAAGTATLLGADAVVVALVGDGHVQLAGAHGLDALPGGPERVQPGAPLDLTLARQAIATRRPVLVSDTARHGVEQTARGELALGVSACASVPVIVGGEAVATVSALRRGRYEWTADDTAVLRVAAERTEGHAEAALRSLRAPLTA